jgi:inorganic phosphate transporter, PiT family
MAEIALPGSIEPAARAGGPKMDHGINPLQGIIYAGVVAAALLYVAYSIYADVDASECESQIQNPTRKL